MSDDGGSGESGSGARGGEVPLLRDPTRVQRSTFLELFFDLVFAFALTRLADGIIDDLGWIDVAQTAVLLPAVWWVWTLTLWMNDWLDPDHSAVRIAIIMIMLGSLVMAAAVPRAFGAHGIFFAAAYVTIQLGRSYFFARALRGHRLQARGWRVLFWFGISAVPWIAGALARHGLRGLLWAAAVTIDYASAAVNYPTPGLGRNRTADWRLAGEHLSERYRQFVIIALGETILVTGATFSGDFTIGGSAAALASFLASVLLWRIYFDHPVDLVAAAGTASRHPAGLGRRAAYDHVIIVAGIVGTAVGDRLDLTRALSPARLAWILPIVVGPALFVAGRTVYEHTVSARVSWSRLVAVAAFVVTVPVLAALRAPTLAAALTVDAILMGVVLTDATVGLRDRVRPA